MAHPNANETQRRRRAARVRIDYMPAEDTLALVKGRMGPRYPLNIHSGVLDAIIREWAFLKGLGPDPAALEGPKRTQRPELSDPNARANDFGSPAALDRVVCGGRRRSDGQPCEALSVPGRRRCKWHGGSSTGPRTREGREAAARNLPPRGRCSP